MYFLETLSRKAGSGVKLAATWAYDNFWVLRFDLPTPTGEKQRKEFRPIHRVPLGLDGKTGWTWGYPPGLRSIYHRDKVEVSPPGLRSIYHRDKVEVSPSSLLTIHAGEKATDAAAALGLMATTNSGGEKATDQTDWSPVFRFSTITLVPDKDPTGEAWAQILAARLHRVKPEVDVRIIRLPGLPPKGDIVEWIRYHTQPAESDTMRAEIEEMVAETPKWTPLPASTTTESKITNVEFVEGDDGKRKEVPIPMADVVKSIFSATDDWPRRVGRMIFIHTPGRQPDWLPKTASLFGWLAQTYGIIDWRRVSGCVSREEVYEEIFRQAQAYPAIETMPHEPLMPGHYYACPAIEPGDGRHLEALLEFFCPETPEDRQLLTAAIATPIWGGPAGSRPAFMFTAPKGRGKGKIALAQKIAKLYGNAIDVGAKEEMAKVKTRILSPAAEGKRILLLDNVKTTRFSWAELEALITSTQISGHALYLGEGSLPKNFTVLITLNGASLSTDLAQRVVEIKLRTPEFSDDWQARVDTFIAEHRDKIFGDIVGFLRSQRKRIPNLTRWATWEGGVLSHVDDPAKCLNLIRERRAAVDVEEEEGRIIEDYFAGQLRWLGYDPDRDDVFIPSATAARWYNSATGDNCKVAGASRALKQMFLEDRTDRISPARTSVGRDHGFRWVGEHADVEGKTLEDLGQRLAKKLEELRHREQPHSQEEGEYWQ